MSIASLKLLLVAPTPDAQGIVSQMREPKGWQLAIEPDCSLAMAHFRTLLPDVVVLFDGGGASELAVMAQSIQSGTHGRPASIVLVAGADFVGQEEIPNDEILSPGISTEELRDRILRSCRAISEKRIRIAMDMAIENFVSDAMVSLSSTSATLAPDSIPNSDEIDVLAKQSGRTAQTPREQTEVLQSGGLVASLLPEVEESTHPDDSSDVYVREETVNVAPQGWDATPLPNEPDMGPPSISTGSDFARQLREKMSKMAERLFPEQLTGEDTVSLIPGVPSDSDFEIPESEDGITQLSIDEDMVGTGNQQLVSDSDIGRDRSSYRARAQPEERALRFAGELGDGEQDISRLIAKFWQTRFSGWITFEEGTRELRLDFEEGRVVFVRSRSSDDRMGELLLRQGKVNQKQLADCQDRVSESGRRMGELLVELGYLKPRELLPAVRHHLEDLYYSLFAWTEGRYEAVQGVSHEEKIRMSRHPAALMVEGIRRKYSRGRLRRCLGDMSTVIFALPSSTLTSTLSSAELTLGEAKAHALFLGENTLAEIAQSSGIGELRVAQLAFAWVCLGVAEVVNGDMEGQTRPGRGTQPLIGDSDLEIDRERALAKHRLVENGDYFQVLGVREDASAFEIRRAYEAAQRYYNSETFPSELRSELDDVLSDIEEVIDEAYEVLSDDSIREQYRENLH